MTRTNTYISATVYFLLSALLTGIFITRQFWLYNSVEAMILSGCIASGKWLIQIVAALSLLKEKKWNFIRRTGQVCLVGSAVLFVYYGFPFLPFLISGFSQFVLSITLSVLVMIWMYYKAVKKTGISINWFLCWLACLAVAVFLQAKVVF